MSTKKNAAYNVAYRMFSVLLPIVTAPYLSRVCGTDGVGLYSDAWTMSEIFCLIGMLGLADYGVRTIAQVRDSREDLDRITDEKIRALIDRALLRIEESAEEKLFQKDLFQGTKLFLTTNFPRWRGAEPEPEESGDGLGLFALWGN